MAALPLAAATSTALRKTASDACFTKVIDSLLQSNSPSVSQNNIPNDAMSTSSSRDLLRSFSSSIFRAAMAPSGDNSLNDLLSSFQESASSAGFDDLNLSMATDADLSTGPSTASGAAQPSSSTIVKSEPAPGVMWAVGDDDLTSQLDDFSDYDVSSMGGLSGDHSPANSPLAHVSPAATMAASNSSEWLNALLSETDATQPLPLLEETAFSLDSYENLLKLGEELADDPMPKSSPRAAHTSLPATMAQANNPVRRSTRSQTRGTAPSSAQALNLLQSPSVPIGNTDQPVRPPTPPRSIIPPVAMSNTQNKPRRRPTKREQQRQLKQIEERHQELKSRISVTQAACSDTLGVLLQIWREGKMAGL